MSDLPSSHPKFKIVSVFAVLDGKMLLSTLLAAVDSYAITKQGQGLERTSPYPQRPSATWQPMLPIVSLQACMDIFGRAIQRYIRMPDKKQLLLCLLDWMTGQGYSVDSSSRNLLLRNAQFFGQTQLIAELLSKQQAASRTLGQRHKK